MHPHLLGLDKDIDAVAEEVARLRERSPEQLARKPAPGAWSALECVEHLVITGEMYHARIRGAIDRSETKNREAPFRPSLTGRFFIRAVSPQPKRRVKTFNTFQPVTAGTDPSVFDRFMELQEELRDLVHRADGVALNGPKLSSPVSPLVRFTVGDALTVLVRHQQRHLEQAWRALEQGATVTA